MKVFTCEDHDGWRADDHGRSSATIVVARTEERARQLLDARLRRMGLRPHAEKPYSLHRLDIRGEKVRLLGSIS